LDSWALASEAQAEKRLLTRTNYRVTAWVVTKLATSTPGYNSIGPQYVRLLGEAMKVNRTVAENSRDEPGFV
jgi:hypothetical protein